MNTPRCSCPRHCQFRVIPATRSGYGSTPKGWVQLIVVRAETRKARHGSPSSVDVWRRYRVRECCALSGARELAGRYPGFKNIQIHGGGTGWICNAT